MAKTKYEYEAQQEEMAVVIFRLKGGAGTLQKGFETISQAISAFGPQGRVATRTAPKELAATTANGAVEVDETDIEDSEQQDDAEAPARATRSTGQKKEKWKFLSEFNMDGVNGVTFKDFASTKGELIDDHKYMVAAYWLQKHGGLESFSGSHLFTCFRTMGWATRDDMTQPMRRLKSEKSYFDRLGKGQWKLNTHGLQATEAIGK